MSERRSTDAKLDSAIDLLLGRGARPVPVDDDGLMAVARLLAEELPRFQPRLGFEELLVERLAIAAAGTRAATRPDPVPLHDPDPSEPARDSGRRRRGLVAGGAIASGVSLAIPIAGAALVVWRRARATGGVV
jgi:hypothetical protein